MRVVVAQKGMGMAPGERSLFSTGVRLPGEMIPVACLSSTGLSHLLDVGCEFLDEVVYATVLADKPRDVRGRVDHSRVISPAEAVTDLW